MKKIVIATTNIGKIKDFEQVFTPLGYELVTLKDLAPGMDIEETGSTFVENAILKAETLANILKIPVIADDSGLCVDALNGAPGVYSARYAGDHDDHANNVKLLEQLKDTPTDKRTAYYICVIAMVTPHPTDKPTIITVAGKTDGFIAHTPAGENGFAYDTLFYTPEYGCTFAQLTDEERLSVSHRKRAIDALQHHLDALETL